MLYVNVHHTFFFTKKKKVGKKEKNILACKYNYKPFVFKRRAYMNKVFIVIKFIILLIFLSIALMCLPHINLNIRTLLPLLVNAVILIAIVVLLYKKFKK